MTLKQLPNLLIGINLLLLTACGQAPINKNTGMDSTQFEAFRHKEKFTKDERLHYPGIADLKIKAMLSEKINQSAEDFKALAAAGTATESEYQEAIKKGLNRFADVYLYLDTEDRERVCYYYEELMDLVDLQSSGGHLNDFMYGFDPK